LGNREKGPTRNMTAGNLGVVTVIIGSGIFGEGAVNEIQV
jgi:hypothetical protein